MNQQQKAYGLALLSIAFWSTMGTAFKLTLQYLNPALLLLFVTFTAVLFLLSTLAIRNKLYLLQNLSKRSYLNSAVMGFFNPFMYYMVLFKAYDMIQAQEAVALNYIWPVMLVIFSIIFLKQPVSILSFIAILVSFSGTFIIASHGNILGFRLSNPFGSSLAIFSSIFWASFWILNLKDKREEESKMFLNFVFGFLYILIWNIATGNFAIPPLKGLVGSIYIGIFEMGVTFVLWLTALRLSTTTARVSNLVFLSPFLSLLLVATIVGEKLLPSTIIGLLFIVGGIVLQQLSAYRKAR